MSTSPMRSPRGGPSAAVAAAGQSEVGAVVHQSEPQRVIVIGASGSGKTALWTTVYGRHALQGPGSGLSTGMDRQSSPHHALNDPAKPIPGRCVVNQKRLRATAEKPMSMDDRQSSKNLAGPAKSHRDDDSASIAASQRNTTIGPVPVVDVAVGSDVFLPVQVLELRDSEGIRMLHDKVLGRECISSNTTAIVITIDTTALFDGVPTITRPEVDALIRTLAAQHRAGSAPLPSSNSSEPSPTSTPLRPSRLPATNGPGGRDGSSAASVAPSAAEDVNKTILSIPDQMLYDAYKVALNSRTNGAAQAEYGAALTLCRNMIECVRRYHPCPPSVTITVAFTRADVLRSVFEARHCAADEAVRLGEGLVRRKRDCEATTSDVAAVVAVRSTGNAVPAVVKQRPVTLRQADAVADMRRELAALVKRFELDLEASDRTSMSNTSMTPDTTVDMSVRSAGGGSRRVASQPAMSCTMPPVTVSIVSTVDDEGDSVCHLMNSILCPMPFVDDRLRRLLDGVRTSCRLKCAALIDLNSLQFIAADTVSAAKLPHQYLLLRRRVATRTGEDTVHTAERAAMEYPTPQDHAALQGKLCGTRVMDAEAQSNTDSGATPIEAVAITGRRTTFQLPLESQGGTKMNCRRGAIDVPAWRAAARMIRSVAAVNTAGHGNGSAADASGSSASRGSSRPVSSGRQGLDAPPPSGEWLRASITTANDLVLLARGVTADHVALIGVTTAKDFAMETVLAANVDHFSRAVTGLANRAVEVATPQATSVIGRQAVVVSPRR